MGRNPKTGTPVEVPAKKILYFKPSKELKEVVNARARLPEPDDPSAQGLETTDESGSNPQAISDQRPLAYTPGD